MTPNFLGKSYRSRKNVKTTPAWYVLSELSWAYWWGQLGLGSKIRVLLGAKRGCFAKWI